MTRAAVNLHFSPEGGFIASDFESSGGGERHTDRITEFRKIAVDAKSK